MFSGALFPFLFITIACGAVSGFHALISSGTTPKMLENETQARFIGYGGMLTESFVAIMALIAASVLDPGIYFAMNSPTALIGTTPEQAAQVISGWGFVVTPDALTEISKDVGEASILSRAGGAPTLAVGMAYIFSNLIGGKALMAFWYHFAILFEALFILTTIDAGTRVGRFMIHDLLGAFHEPLRHTSHGRLTCCRRRCACRCGATSSGSGRSARRHQHAVAAVRHLQPDAGRDRVDAGNGRAVQDEAGTLRLGDDRTDDLALYLHPDGGFAEAVPS